MHDGVCGFKAAVTTLCVCVSLSPAIFHLPERNNVYYSEFISYYIIVFQPGVLACVFG